MTLSTAAWADDLIISQGSGGRHGTGSQTKQDSSELAADLNTEKG